MAVDFLSASPVLRIFDEKKAREFYIDFLGFSVAFEHRFDDGLPLYMGVLRGNVELHLSEHFGDACPGAAVRVRTGDVSALAADLRAKTYRHANPASPTDPTPWGTLEFTLTDPFGNRLTFWSPA